MSYGESHWARRTRLALDEAVAADDEESSSEDEYKPGSEPESASDDEAAQQPKRRRFVQQLPANVPDYVLELVEQQADAIASGLINYIEIYKPRLRSEETAAKPDPRDPYKQLFTAYAYCTEREVRSAEHLYSDAYDEDKDLVGRTSITYDGPPIGKTTGRKVSPTSVKEGMQEGVADAEITQVATTFEGKWGTTVNVSPARLKWNDRTLELLTQLSTLLFAHVSQKCTTEEVEAMVVNGRVLISANEVGAVKQLLGVCLRDVLDQQKELIASLKSAISEQNATTLAQTMSAMGARSGEKLTEDQQEGIKWLAQTGVDGMILDDEDETAELAGLLEALYQAVVAKTNVVKGGEPESAAGRITDGANAGAIIVVDAWEYTPKPTEKTPEPKSVVCSHAEQNLVYALVCSGHQDGAQVAGKKRPCTACSLSLKLADDAGYKVKYNPHPGGYWEGTTYRGLQRIAAKLGITDAEQLNAWIRGVVGDEEFAQYITLAKELDDVPDEVSAKLVIGNGAPDRPKFSTAEGSVGIKLSYDPPSDEDEEDE
jgi:hypothetical protein